MPRALRHLVPPNSVVAYLRVSTEEQADSGAGLAAQRAAIEVAADQRRWHVLAWHVDAGASGKSMNGRPELAKALDEVRQGRAAGIVVAKLDRLSRSVLDFAGLMADANKRGWNIVALDLGIDLSTPAGKLVAGMMANVAEWERDVISQRTKDGLAAKKAAGTRLGRPSALPTDVVSRIVAARNAGQGYSVIARALNDEQVPTAQGGARWYPSTVQKVLVGQDADGVKLLSGGAGKGEYERPADEGDQ
jgi:DNA invertase Pin-like site-specific DNA recombinase